MKPVPIFYSVGEGRQARRRGWVAGDGWQACPDFWACQRGGRWTQGEVRIRDWGGVSVNLRYFVEVLNC